MITKSLFLQGLQCKKLFWMSLHSSYLLSSDNELQEFIYQQGHEIGDFAKRLFSNGVDAKTDEFMAQIYNTKQLLNDQGVIFEASFLYERLFCRVDILEYTDEGWNIIEVKSSTSVKPVHIDDISFQYFILSNLNLNINMCKIMYLNKSYKRQDHLEINQLFRFEDVTQSVKDNYDRVSQMISELSNVKKQSEMPDIPIGKHCFSPYQCSACNYCWSDVPRPSIFDLRDLSMDHKFLAYYKNKFRIDDLSVDQFSKKIQKIQLTAFQDSVDYINTTAVKLFFNQFSYPLTFIDFECYQQAIPKFKDERVYQQIPFQFSFYVLDENGELDFDSYLHTDISDPRRSFCDNLLSKIPDSGTIVVFKKDLEIQVLSHLKALFNDDSDRIQLIIDRILDLSDLFSLHDIYFRDMMNDFSLKSIIRVINPDISFSLLDIDDGALAHVYYRRYLNGEIDQKEFIRILSDYSRMDVFSLVSIYQAIKSIID